MKFEIDDIKRKAITSQVFNKTALIKHVDANIDGDYKTSFTHLNNMCEGPIELLRDRVIATHSKISATYRMGNACVNPTFAVSHFIWGRIYVWAYYFMHDNSLWQQHIFPLMLDLQKSAKIKEDMHTAEKLLETYFEEQSQYEKAIKASNSNIQSTAPQNHLVQTECMPDVIQTMQDINTGKIDYSDIDWELQIKTVLKLINIMPTKYPNVIWLWGLLGEIDDINKRIEILHKMQEVATKCFEDLFQASDFIKDCDCLIYVYQGSLQYNTKNIGIRHYWTDDKKHMNDLAHILCKEMVDPKFMVAIAEEMYQASQGDRKQYMLSLVLRASRNIGQISMDNIIDFAKNLYIAEGFRHLILSGEEDYRDIPALADFEPKLLKACFEEYIRLRTIDIKDIIEQDLTHCGDAEELECLEYLFEEESQHVNRENMLEDFRGSAAYNAMWYPGKQKVLDMINVFIEYLKNKIKKIKKEEAKLGIRDHIQNFNVQGDYIAGDKHVGAHIDNVSPGAIGTQTTKE